MTAKHQTFSISLPPNLFLDIESDRGNKPRSAYITDKLRQAMKAKK